MLHCYPYLKERLMKKLHKEDKASNNLFKTSDSSPITWLDYNSEETLMSFTKVHVGSGMDIVI